MYQHVLTTINGWFPVREQCFIHMSRDWGWGMGPLDLWCVVGREMWGERGWGRCQGQGRSCIGRKPQCWHSQILDICPATNKGVQIVKTRPPLGTGLDSRSHGGCPLPSHEGAKHKGFPSGITSEIISNYHWLRWTSTSKKKCDKSLCIVFLCNQRSIQTKVSSNYWGLALWIRTRTRTGITTISRRQRNPHRPSPMSQALIPGC